VVPDGSKPPAIVMVQRKVGSTDRVST